MEPVAQPLKRCGCGSPTDKCPDLPRTIEPAKVNPDSTLVFDVRREADYAASNEIIPGALWKNTNKIDAKISALPLTQDVVIYCEHNNKETNRKDNRQQTANNKTRNNKGGLE